MAARARKPVPQRARVKAKPRLRLVRGKTAAPPAPHTPRTRAAAKPAPVRARVSAKPARPAKAAAVAKPAGRAKPVAAAVAQPRLTVVPGTAPPPERVRREELLQRYAPLIKYVVERLSVGLPRNVDHDDLLSAGTVG